MTEVYVYSDFNIDHFCRYLVADQTSPVCRVDAAPYGQFYQSLDAARELEPEGVAFVWTRPEGVIGEFSRVLNGEAANIDAIIEDVDRYFQRIARLSGQVKCVFVASWVASCRSRGYGMLDYSKDGVSYILQNMNIRLAELIHGASNIFLLNAEYWLDVARPGGRNPKYWFAMKSPFTEQVCRSASKDVKAALRGCLGKSRKVVVVDLDDTLWGGVVGEMGWQNLVLGGHDPLGEAYEDFQQALKTLTRRGIQVALVSKNDEATALAAIDNHPSMVLRRQDIAGWRINWNDKAQNIVDLAADLNVGLSALVFIDDNPAERGRVREALPEVLVPDWPASPAHFGEALRLLDCFDQPNITAEDRSRTRMYVEERSRKASAAHFPAQEEWLTSLDVRVNAQPLGEGNIKRVSQLLLKTNQMNLCGRRLGVVELKDWLSGGDDRFLLAVSVADRFGDLGLTGVVGWEIHKPELRIVDFVLSCRAMGRKIENTLLHLAVEAAGRAGCGSVVARGAGTGFNGPCFEFWRRSGFEEVEPEMFRWRLPGVYARPGHVALTVEADI